MNVSLHPPQIGTYTWATACWGDNSLRFSHILRILCAEELSVFWSGLPFHGHLYSKSTWKIKWVLLEWKAGLLLSV